MLLTVPSLVAVEAGVAGDTVVVAIVIPDRGCDGRRGGGVTVMLLVWVLVQEGFTWHTVLSRTRRVSLPSIEILAMGTRPPPPPARGQRATRRLVKARPPRAYTRSGPGPWVSCTRSGQGLMGWVGTDDHSCPTVSGRTCFAGSARTHTASGTADEGGASVVVVVVIGIVVPALEPSSIW